MLNRNTTLICAAAGAVTLATSVAALARSSATVDTTTQAGASSSSNIAIERLAVHYGSVMGCTASATALIDAMGAGKHVTFGDTTIAGNGKAMGYANINIALALAKAHAEANAKAGESLSAQGFLTALGDVMERRSGGLGWGQIAKDLGFSLDQVLSASYTAQVATRTSQSAQVAAAQQVNGTTSVNRHRDGSVQGRAGADIDGGVAGGLGGIGGIGRNVGAGVSGGINAALI